MWCCIYRKHTTDTQETDGWPFIWYPTYDQEQEKSEFFDFHYQQHFNSTTIYTYLCMWMTFKVLNQVNNIGIVKNLQNLTVVFVWRNFYQSLKSSVTDTPSLWKNIQRYMGPDFTRWITHTFLLRTDYPINILCLKW